MPKSRASEIEVATVGAGGRREVLVVRGRAANPFELQSYDLIEDDFSVTVVVGPSGMEQDTLKFRVLRLNDLDSRLGPLRSVVRRRNNSDWLLHRLFGLERLIRQSDLVHCAETYIPFSYQAVEAARRAGKKSVATCWETIPFWGEESSAVRERKAFVRAHCDAFIAVTKRARDALVAEGIHDSRIEVIPAGVDLDRFERSPASGAAFRREHSIPVDALVVLLPGRLIREKGGVDLLRAFATADLASAGGIAVFIGSGTERARIDAAARALGIRENVMVLSHVDYMQMPPAFSASDIVAVPSLATPYWEEQFGMVLAEAMAASSAIVAYDSGAIPEVLGEAGRLVPQYSVPHLAEALRSMALSADLRSQLGAAARQRAESIYDRRKVARSLVSAYHRVLAA